MLKERLSNSEARGLDRKSLFEHLESHFETPGGRWHRATVLNAANLIRSGEVLYTEVLTAIRNGWEPSEIAIRDFMQKQKQRQQKESSQRDKGGELRFNAPSDCQNGPGWAAIDLQKGVVLRAVTRPNFSIPSDATDVKKLRQVYREKCQQIISRLSSLGVVVPGRTSNDKFICKKNSYLIAKINYEDRGLCQ